MAGFFCSLHPLLFHWYSLPGAGIWYPTACPPLPGEPVTSVSVWGWGVSRGARVPRTSSAGGDGVSLNQLMFWDKEFPGFSSTAWSNISTWWKEVSPKKSPLLPLNPHPRTTDLAQGEGEPLLVKCKGKQRRLGRHGFLSDTVIPFFPCSSACQVPMKSPRQQQHLLSSLEYISSAESTLLIWCHILHKLLYIPPLLLLSLAIICGMFFVVVGLGFFGFGFVGFFLVFFQKHHISLQKTLSDFSFHVSGCSVSVQTLGHSLCPRDSTAPANTMKKAISWYRDSTYTHTLRSC